MPTQVTNYQCPACTGPLHFVGASGKLECDYCGSTYDVAEIEALYAEKEAKAAETQQKEEQKQAARKQEAADNGWDTSDTVSYTHLARIVIQLRYSRSRSRTMQTYFVLHPARSPACNAL